MSSNEVRFDQSITKSPIQVTTALSRKVVLVQSVMAGLLILPGFLMFGLPTSIAVASGSLCSLLPVLAFNRFFQHRNSETSAPQGFLRRYYLAEITKLVLTVVLLILALNIHNRYAPALMIGFLASLLAGWVALPLFALNGARHGT